MYYDNANKSAPSAPHLIESGTDGAMMEPVLQSMLWCGSATYVGRVAVTVIVPRDVSTN